MRGEGDDGNVRFLTFRNLANVSLHWAYLVLFAELFLLGGANGACSRSKRLVGTELNALVFLSWNESLLLNIIFLNNYLNNTMYRCNRLNDAIHRP